MPDAKRPDPKRRAPASRPGKAGDAKRGRPRTAAVARREPRVAAPVEPPADPEALDEPQETEEPVGVIEPIRRAIAEAAEQQSEQRLGSAARRAAILAAVVCVLTLTIAGPVRTYFSQRAEVQQLAAAEAQLRAQIAELEQQKIKLGDPVYIAAQARERLGFVKPGDIPYQVQLPPGATPVAAPEADAATAPSNDPWYTALWHTIADAPHGVSAAPLPPPPGTLLPPTPPGPPNAPLPLPPGG